MEPQTASVYSSGSVPRLRVKRRPSSTTSSVSPPMRRPTDPQFYPDSQTTSEDEMGTLGVAGETPRLLSASLPPPDSTAESSGTAHRLRAILDRFDTSSRTLASASRNERPPSPSEPESDFDVPPAQAARASIKVLLQNALREPGDTPQKPKLTRRASFNATGSPKVKSRRKSTSDEEIETSAKRYDERPSEMSTAASLDRLRLQLTESMPSIQASSSSSTSRPLSEANGSTSKPVSTSHHPRASKIPVSNSPIRHAKTHQDLESFATASRGVGDSTQQGNHLNHSRTQTSPSHPRSITGLHSNDAVLSESSRRNPTPSSDHRERLRTFQHGMDEQEQDRNRYNTPPLARVRTSSGNLHSAMDRNSGRLSPGALPTSPTPGTRVNGTRSPRHSLTKRETGSTDGHSEDGRSSRGTSLSSNAEYRERLKETERERQRDLERNWNRPRAQHSQSVPHLHGHASRLGFSADLEHSHPRASHDPARAASPSSSTSSRSHPEEEAEDVEVIHERERNWNAPRPKWGQHPHHGSESDHYQFPRAPSPLPPHTAAGGEHVHATTHGRHRTSSSASLGPTDGQLNSRPHSLLQSEPPRPHSRLENRHDYPRTGSPSSSTSSRSHQAEDVEELHERERNWNAPRPKWDQHSPHPHHHAALGHEADHHLSRTASSHSLGDNASVDREQTGRWGRHPSNASLGISANGKGTRSDSPIPRTQSLGDNSSHASLSVRSTHPHHPRSNTTPSEKRSGRDKLPETAREHDWNSSKVSPSHRYESAPLSPSPGPSRPRSRATSAAALTTTHSALNGSTRQSMSPSPSSIPQPVPTSDTKKGHRRTTTELSEAMGPFPRQSAITPALAIPDEESDGSLFADESIPPPRMSTPTFKKTHHLLDLSISSVASDTPLPPSPPSPEATIRGLSARADSDFARLQRAVVPEFTFPARQSSPPEAPVLSTPPRRSSFNTKKIEFRTPSPPLGLPDLPGPPSSDEEGVTTPLRENEPIDHNSLSTMKTPRFPGAFGTPAPPPSAPVLQSPVEDDVSTGSDEVEKTPKLEPIDAITQPQTLGKYDVTATPGAISAAVTPAPPGAYRATPTPSKRKGILKVRFDGDIQSSGNGDETEAAANAVVPAIDINTLPPSPSSEDIPPLSLSPSRRKGLRLVDEYGRARRFTEDGEEIILDPRRKGATAPQSPTRTSPLVDDVTLTPRRRAKMRQVDALGNEIRDEPDRELPEKKTSKKGVFSRLTRSLSELQSDLAHEEDALTASMPLGGPRADERLMDLAGVSKTARVERNKLARKLQLERNAEGGIADKVYVARNPALSPMETTTRVSWWRRKWRLALCLLILELVVLCVGYRLASMQAKQAWLATHYDPFFPALYLRKSPPSYIGRFGTLPVDWSAFAISGAVRRVGVWGFVEGVGKQVWEGIWTWRMEPWEIWGSPAAGPPVPQAWPPS